ncbi:RING/FYVE/PHD-type [Hexamita inflata]|uniref:RING/FYVE/PHD-type n=1 Tax=Hexamita inflata TaxID=28002 RepID=A0AA86PF19_9EUKA|nr:RING/FYVE/PHD-type [Hexamita inflata]
MSQNLITAFLSDRNLPVQLLRRIQENLLIKFNTTSVDAPEIISYLQNITDYHQFVFSPDILQFNFTSTSETCATCTRFRMEVLFNCGHSACNSCTLRLQKCPQCSEKIVFRLLNIRKLSLSTQVTCPFCSFSGQIRVMQDHLNSHKQSQQQQQQQIPTTIPVNPQSQTKEDKNASRQQRLLQLKQQMEAELERERKLLDEERGVSTDEQVANYLKAAENNNQQLNNQQNIQQQNNIQQQQINIQQPINNQLKNNNNFVPTTNQLKDQLELKINKQMEKNELLAEQHRIIQQNDQLNKMNESMKNAEKPSFYRNDYSMQEEQLHVQNQIQNAYLDQIHEPAPMLANPSPTKPVQPFKDNFHSEQTYKEWKQQIEEPKETKTVRNETLKNSEFMTPKTNPNNNLNLTEQLVNENKMLRELVQTQQTLIQELQAQLMNQNQINQQVNNNLQNNNLNLLNQNNNNLNNNSKQMDQMTPPLQNNQKNVRGQLDRSTSAHHFTKSNNLNASNLRATQLQQTTNFQNTVTLTSQSSSQLSSTQLRPSQLTLRDTKYVKPTKPTMSRLQTLEEKRGEPHILAVPTPPEIRINNSRGRSTSAQMKRETQNLIEQKLKEINRQKKQFLKK